MTTIHALQIRDNAGGHYINSIFTDFANEGIDVEDLDSGEDSRARLEAGDLKLANNIWWGFGAGNELSAIAPDVFVADHLAANENRIVDPMLNGISRDTDGGLIPGRWSEGPPIAAWPPRRMMDSTRPSTTLAPLEAVCGLRDGPSCPKLALQLLTNR